MKLSSSVKSLFKSAENKYTELPRRLNNRSKSSISKFEIVKRDKFRTTQSIGKWRQAMILAEDVELPDNSYLMDLYDDVVLDAHLSAVMNVRRLKVTGKVFHIKNRSSGEVNEVLTTIFQKEWFYSILNVMMDAVFYGTQLFELEMIGEGEFKVNVIPKRNFESKISEFYVDSWEKYNGEDYADYLHQNLFELTHSSGEFGLILKACPHALVKKDVMAFWAEYTEIYGMPIRIGKTNIRDKDRAQELNSSLRDLGSSAYAVLDESEDLEFLESSKSTNHEIYSSRAEFANSEMSKIILGQTMTTDDGASLSQSEVHERVMSSIEMADLKWIDRWVTHVLIPRMRFLGFLKIPETDEFNFDLKRTLDIQSQFNIITTLLDKGYDIPIDYLQEFTAIPIDGKRENPVETQPNSHEIRNYLKKKKFQNKQIELYYNELPKHACSGSSCAHPQSQFMAKSDDLDKIIERIIKVTYSNKYAEELDEELINYVYDKLYGGIEQGFDQVSQLGGQNTEFIQAITHNTFFFSAAKNKQFMEMLNASLIDDNGELVSFSYFKELALKYHDQYNVNWLRTEYDTAVNNGYNIAKWQQIEAQQDVFPLLRYKTVRDERVREIHKQWEGITLPVNHPFWNTHFPANGFGCRCSAEQITSGNITPDSEFGGEPDKYFDFNPAKHNSAFSLNHPYFKDFDFGDKTVLDFSKKLIKNAKEKNIKINYPFIKQNGEFDDKALEDHIKKLIDPKNNTTDSEGFFKIFETEFGGEVIFHHEQNPIEKMKNAKLSIHLAYYKDWKIKLLPDLNMFNVSNLDAEIIFGSGKPIITELKIPTTHNAYNIIHTSYKKFSNQLKRLEPYPDKVNLIIEFKNADNFEKMKQLFVSMRQNNKYKKSLESIYLFKKPRKLFEFKVKDFLNYKGSDWNDYPPFEELKSIFFD